MASQKEWTEEDREIFLSAVSNAATRPPWCTVLTPTMWPKLVEAWQGKRNALELQRSVAKFSVGTYSALEWAKLKAKGNKPC